jgi:hypothetical protein
VTIVEITGDMLPARTSGYAKGCSVAATCLAVLSCENLEVAAQFEARPEHVQVVVVVFDVGTLVTFALSWRTKSSPERAHEGIRAAYECRLLLDADQLRFAPNQEPRPIRDALPLARATTTARPSRSRAGAVETLGKLIDESQRLHCGRDPLLFDFSPLASDRICESPQGQRIAL